MKKLIGFATFALVSVAVYFHPFSAPPSSEDTRSTPVVVGVLPDQDTATLSGNLAPLLAYLGQETGEEFELLIPDDYEHLLSLFEDGLVDLAYFGGLTFVHASESLGAVPLVMRAADRNFTTTFVVRNEPPWNTCQRLACEALKGTVITFGSRLSTSGHLMPRHFLQSELGIVPEEHFLETRYSGAHDLTARAVRSGDAAIGAMNTAIYNEMLVDGRLLRDALIPIWQTPPYANYVWAVQPDLDSDLIDDIREAFLGLSMSERDQRGILLGLRAEAFLPASGQDYDALATVVIASGLLPNQ